jgi:ABC-type amino acid transport substrate-binding protein
LLPAPALIPLPAFVCRGRLLAATLLFAAAGLAAAASPTLDRIRTSGTIQFGYREGVPPFAYKDRDGQVRGYSVELCTRVAAALQDALKLPALKVEWVPVTAETRLAAVAGGRVDVECGTTTMTLSRMEQVDFSVPIFADGGSVLVRANSKLTRMTDLKGRKLAVIAGTTTEHALAAHLTLLEAPATLVPVKDSAEGMALLTGAKVDGFAGDRIVLTQLRQRTAKPQDLAFVVTDFSFEPYALVVRRDDPDFRLAVNRALVGLYRSGEIDGIFQRWFASLGRPGPLLHSMFYLNTLPD